MTITSVQGATNGTVTFVNGVITFTPAADYNGPASFTYTVSDSKRGFDTATVNVAVTPINDAPRSSATAALAAGTEDTGYTVSAADLLKGFSDVEGNVLSVIGLVADKGTVTDNGNGTFTITPTADHNGSVKLTYRVSDGQGGETGATQSSSLAAVNDAPVVASALADQTSAEDAAWSFTVPAGTFADVDNASLALSATLGDGKLLPSWLSFDAKTGTFSGTPPQDFDGEIELKVTATDGSLSVSEVFKLDITPVNDAPVATGGDTSGDEDTAIKGTVGGTDIDGDKLTYSLVEKVAGLSLNADGSYSYKPADNFNGEVSFQYVANDGKVDSAPKTVTITVKPVNDAPVANSDAAAAVEDGSPITIDVLANDTDVDGGDTKTLVSLNGAGTIGAISIVGGLVSYDVGSKFQALNAGQTATDTFTYVMKDSKGAEEAATVTITVTGVNDAPTAVADLGAAAEDGGAVLVDVLVNDTDADSGDSKTLLSVDRTGTVGSVSMVDGKISYDTGANFQKLKAGETTTDTFTYTMRDAAGVTSSAKVTMTITGVNDGPKAASDTGAIDEDQTTILDLLSNDTDIDGDVLTITEAKAAFGTATIVTVEGKTYVSYAASADSFDKLATGASASDTITYKIADGKGGFSTATATIMVTGTNDGIVIAGTNQADTINGQLTALGKDRDETIEGFNGTDVLNGKGGADRLIGGNGDDTLIGENGWDELYGDHGNDRLDGGAGLDFLDGGLGDDRLTGGADADVFFFGKANGNDTIMDFQAGVDKLQLASGVSIKNRSMIDTDGNGTMDSTLLQLSTGTVTLVGVTDAAWGGLLG